MDNTKVNAHAADLRARGLLSAPAIDLVVTRHNAFVEYLSEQGLIPEGVEIRAHVGIADVKGRHVLGVLPHHLSSACASITEVKLDLTREDREAMQAGDLPLDRVRAVAGQPETYRVFGGPGLEDKIAFAAGEPKAQLMADLYRLLASLHAGTAKPSWGGRWEPDSTRAYRALQAARSWIPYDLMGPGPFCTPFKAEDEPGIWNGGFTACYTAGNAHLRAWAHRGGMVKVGRMSVESPWVDIDSMEPVDIEPELLDD